MGRIFQTVKQSLISVIIPNYNGERFIEQAINSVLNQSYKNIELIIVDDCSTDSSKEIIQNYCQKDDRVRMVELKNNGGVSVARNRGIDEAQGKYIALLDNDDIWELDKLERQIDLAEKGADIVYCSYDFIDENNETIKHPFFVPECTDFKHMLTCSVISCSTGFFKAELLKTHPFDSEFYHEDYVLWMQLLKIPIVARGDTKVLMHYRQLNGSRSNRKSNAAKERWNIYRQALGLNLCTSIRAFIGYALKGVIKYYF